MSLGGRALKIFQFNFYCDVTPDQGQAHVMLMLIISWWNFVGETNVLMSRAKRRRKKLDFQKGRRYLSYQIKRRNLKFKGTVRCNLLMLLEMGLKQERGLYWKQSEPIVTAKDCVLTWFIHWFGDDVASGESMSSKCELWMKRHQTKLLGRRQKKTSIQSASLKM